jgi:hypothetical protein
VDELYWKCMRCGKTHPVSDVANYIVMQRVDAGVRFFGVPRLVSQEGKINGYLCDNCVKAVYDALQPPPLPAKG